MLDVSASVDGSTFVAGITIPDGAIRAPYQEFEKHGASATAALHHSIAIQLAGSVINSVVRRQFFGMPD